MIKHNKSKTDSEILERASAALKRNTLLNVDIRKMLLEAGHRDAQLSIGDGENFLTFPVEIKKNATRTLIGMIQHQRLINPRDRDTVLIAPYVTPPIADLMREAEIQFMDTAGNAYINKPPIFIFIKGNKIPEKDRGRSPARAFRPTGLQVVFALLCNRGLENAPYREIAEKANVALGTVGWVMRDLREMGYLIDMGKRGRRLSDRFNLLLRFVNAYPEELKPKRLLGRYSTEPSDWWKVAEINMYEAYWGGEAAAALVTGYLKPEKVTIYTRQSLAGFMLKHKIRKDPRGTIEIYDAFWNFEYEWEHRNIAPPILVYADLLGSGDTRNTKAADLIYEQGINRLIGQD